MRYSYTDLGPREAGTVVTVRLTGSASNVMLLDPPNFARYRANQPFLYTGGSFARSPVRLEVPEDGRWFVVVDLGGYKGRVNASIEVESQDGSRATDSRRTITVH